MSTVFNFRPETFVHEIGALKLLCGAPCRNFYISQKRKIRACITCGVKLLSIRVLISLFLII